jgi:hypothetical protein
VDTESVAKAGLWDISIFVSHYFTISRYNRRRRVSMRFFFILLGLAARIGQALSRFRINFIPFNWIAMFVLFVLMTVGFSFAGEGLQNSDKPQEVTVADIIDHKVNLSRNFVTIKGSLSPPSFSKTKKRSKYSDEEVVTEIYAIFVDKENK